jgi:hypothetical protein
VNTISADDVTVTCPLFHEEYGGSTPTSALQLIFSPIDVRRAAKINNLWHSRLPEFGFRGGCFAYCAEFNNVVYAVAIWGPPLARAFNGKGFVELRRMAIAASAPKNTATRMIGWMLRDIKKTGRYVKAISYQDTEVHTGTIYKASGWSAAYVSLAKNIRWAHHKRPATNLPAISDKIRWEYDL